MTDPSGNVSSACSSQPLAHTYSQPGADGPRGEATGVDLQALSPEGGGPVNHTPPWRHGGLREGTSSAGRRLYRAGAAETGPWVFLSHEEKRRVLC